MLTDSRAFYNGQVVEQQRGVMAGTPTAPFLADVYLSEMDHYFADAGVIYARYSDDIIIFAPSQEELLEYRKVIYDFLESHHLKVNPSKEKFYAPGEPYEFLGFRCADSFIDISSASIDKMKGKISRKRRSILRWKQRSRAGVRPVSDKKAVERMVKYFNNKFFESESERTLTWSRWYFPIINTTKGLEEIDHYMQQNIRALVTGRHSKANFKVKYQWMRELGYKSLVHEYYLRKKSADCL